MRLVKVLGSGHIKWICTALTMPLQKIIIIGSKGASYISTCVFFKLFGLFDKVDKGGFMTIYHNNFETMEGQNKFVIINK